MPKIKVNHMVYAEGNEAKPGDIIDVSDELAARLLSCGCVMIAETNTESPPKPRRGRPPKVKPETGE